MLSDELGLLDFSAGAMPKKRIEEQLRAVQAESPLPWVPVPARWAWATLVAAAELARTAGGPVPAELSHSIERLGAPTPEPAPVYARLPAEDAGSLERSAALLALPELTSWFLDPAGVTSEALEWLQARESRLVVSEQIKAERLASLVDRIVETHFDGPARRRWQARLEDQAYVLLALGRTPEAQSAVAVARALADPADSLRRIPFLRALVERSLEVAGEVATGRLSVDAASRAPRARAAQALGGG